MKAILIALGVVVVLLAVSIPSVPAVLDYWENLVAPKFRTVEVTEGRVMQIVRASGTVKPVLEVKVGSFVSGPIDELYTDFNATVKKGQLLAKIDPRTFEAEVASARAGLATAEAEVRRAQASLQQAKNAEGRAVALRMDNEDFISQAEMDDLKFTRMSLEAQLDLAKANVQKAEAVLNNALAALGYTEIRAPVDGIVIDRLVEPGQTVAAAFTTPVLFVVAPDLAGEMHIFAKVDEADIGLVRTAQESNRPVRFTVDAYPDSGFVGKVKQIRSSSSLLEGVVTFPVVVSTTNSERKLLPGMTANLEFEIDSREEALRVPNAAIRFYPPAKHVREEDRKLLSADDDHVYSPSHEQSAEDDDQRHVWVAAGHELKAVQVTVGITDEHFTEILGGDLEPGDEVVVAIEDA